MSYINSTALGAAWFGVVGLSLVSSAGCGRGYDGADRAAVAGTVMLDGAPVTNGTINLIPAAGDSRRKASAVIENGTFSIPAPKGPNLGKYKVEIHWLKRTGRKVASQGDALGIMVDEAVEAIPAKYNTQTTLQVEIVADQNTHDFRLTSLAK